MKSFKNRILKQKNLIKKIGSLAVEKLSKKMKTKEHVADIINSKKHLCFLARGTEKSGHAICVQG